MTLKATSRSIISRALFGPSVVGMLIELNLVLIHRMPQKVVGLL